MRLLGKSAIVLGVACAMALGSMTAWDARNCGAWVAGVAGFAAGAAIGAAEPLQAEHLSMQERPSGVAPPGAALFANNCQACHGSGAGGGVGPKLAGNPILHLDTAFGKIVLYGRGRMPAWEHTLSRQDIAGIQAWLKTL